MSKKKGRLMLLRVGDGETPEVFSVLCGLRSKTLAVNNQEYDVTTADCVAPGGPLWTEVQNGAKRVNVSGNGYVKDEASEARMIAISMSADAIANFELIVPEIGTFAGAFHLSQCELGGEQEDGVTYAVTLASSGAVTFTAAA